MDYARHTTATDYVKRRYLFTRVHTILITVITVIIIIIRSRTGRVKRTLEKNIIIIYFISRARSISRVLRVLIYNNLQ